MKNPTTATIAAAFLASLLFLVAEVEAKQRFFSLTIHPQQEKIESGKDVIVDFTLSNLSDRDIDISYPVRLDIAEIEYQIDVTDSNGKSAKVIKDSVYDEDATLWGSSIRKTLKSHSDWKSSSIINKIYDISKPDTYKISAKYNLSDKLGGSEITSNSVTIVVTQ